MGVFDQDLILPGTITDIVSDYSYGYDTSQFGSTDAVTVIGTAFNGPVGKPVPIYSPEHARYIFGKTFDSKTRKEATLVSEIDNTWERGCRTIYAVRVSGKEIFKDFDLAIDTNLKLRLSGIFPSNDNKEVYAVYDASEGDAKFKIFKPAKRATIQEKMLGLIEKDESILVTTLDLTKSYGLTKESGLIDLLKIINDHIYNNVLKLTIVDENGNDVTMSSKEAQSLTIGMMFPGAYFIGRDTNKCIAATDVQFVLADETNKLFAGFQGLIFKRLKLNTDINAPLPIFGENVDILNKKFSLAKVIMSSMFDILQVPGKIDAVYGKDENDYEEVDIADFELYKQLGSGFATTAKAELKGESDIRVKETPVTDDNRTISIQDGIYSMLENLKSDYRILTNGTADIAINGKLPRKSEFRIAVAKSFKAFNDKVVVTAKFDRKDFSDPKSYKFVLKSVDSSYGQPQAVSEELFTTKIIKKISVITVPDIALVADVNALPEVKGKLFKKGSLFLVVDEVTNVGVLYTFNDKLVKLDDATVNSDLIGKVFLAGDKLFIGSEIGPVGATKVSFDLIDESFFGGKRYILVESAETVAVYELVVDAVTSVLSVDPVGLLHEVFDDNDDKTLITIQSEYIGENVITVKSAALDYVTLEEFVEILNTDKDLKNFFSFAIADDAIAVKDEYVNDPLSTDPVVPVPSGLTAVAVKDRELGWDTNLYVPYKTTDNFARHLAQHCTYTSLKTAPTHGVIGCSKLMDVNLNSVAKKVDSLASLDFNLYAKKPNGRDMLDRNNLPYPIGRCISIVFGQYAVIDSTTGYNYVSNAAAGYAGMISALPLDQSSTNQPINIPNPMFELTNYQLEKLTQKGFVTFKQSYTKGFVVTDGVTMAPVTSPFRRLAVTRIINMAEEVIRAAIEPFIGKQNHLANRNSMQTAVKSALDKLKGRLIEAYEFKLNINQSDLKLGIVDIDYNIVPVYEIREVRNRLTVKDSLN